MSTDNTNDAFQATALKKLDGIQRLLDPHGLAQKAEQAKAKATKLESQLKQEGGHRRKAEAEARDLRRKIEDLACQLAPRTAEDE